MADEVLSLNRLARRLGVPARWLREEADAGRIPCLRAGAHYLFAVAAVQAVLARRAAAERLGVNE
jgi:excisionase family DNA binding protein